MFILFTHFNPANLDVFFHLIIADFTGRFHFTLPVEKFQLSEEKKKKVK
jgi:hypothetical protein